MNDEIKTTKTTYIKEGREYDRVTSVLDFFANPKLVEWKVKLGNKEANKISKVAKATGTRVDGLIKNHVTTGKINLTKNDSQSVVNCTRGYLQWVKDYSPNIIATDKTLFWEELGVAGTLDLQSLDGVIDIKCSESIRKNYWIQVAIYVKMLLTKGEKVDKMGVLRLDKLTGEYEYKVLQFDERFVSLFIGLLSNYRYQQKEKEDEQSGSNETGIVPAFAEIEKVYGF
jgi:hypothetical protein